MIQFLRVLDVLIIIVAVVVYIRRSPPTPTNQVMNQVMNKNSGTSSVQESFSSSNASSLQSQYVQQPTTDSYNTMSTYGNSIHFEVSCPRAKALKEQVSRCKGPLPFIPPEELGEMQKYNCKSYTCRGGYDANKWTR
jgi:hypothetical protein